MTIKFKSSKQARIDQYSNTEEEFIRKCLSLDTTTNEMLSEICSITGASQSEVVRQLIKDTYKQIKNTKK